MAWIKQNGALLNLKNMYYIEECGESKIYIKYINDKSFQMNFHTKEMRDSAYKNLINYMKMEDGVLDLDEDS